MDKFPNNLKMQLKKVNAKGKTTTQIIKEAEIGRTSFYDIMNGNQIPKVDTAFKLARAFDVSIIDLFPKLKEVL